MGLIGAPFFYFVLEILYQRYEIVGAVCEGVVMKRTSVAILLLLCVSGCAAGQLDAKVKRLETSMGDIRGFQAEQTSQISNLQTQVRQLTGRLEELEFSQNKRIGTEVSDLKRDLSTLKRRVPPPANVPVAPLEEDEAMADRLGDPVGPQFADALLKLRSGSYSDALTSFQALLQGSSGSEWAPNVLFWLGVTYDGLGETRNSLSEYNDLVTQYPSHRRAPLSLIRQASVFMKLGDKDTATLTLKKLISDYPNSVEASQAKERLGGGSEPVSKPAPKKK